VLLLLQLQEHVALVRWALAVVIISPRPVPRQQVLNMRSSLVSFIRCHQSLRQENLLLR
jgi:hypothetical protein